MMNRGSLGGRGRTVLAIGVLMAAAAGGLVALESGLAPAPARLPAPVVVFPAGVTGTVAPVSQGSTSARSGERPEPAEPVEIVTPRRAVIIVPPARPVPAAGDP